MELLSSIWWNGPHWLKQPENQWPSSKTAEIPNIQDFDSEVKGNQIIFEAKLVTGEDLSRESTINRRNLLDINEERYSSLSRLLRVTTWVFRAVNKLRKRDVWTGPLTAQELNNAKLLWDLHVQYKHYSDIIDKVKQ